MREVERKFARGDQLTWLTGLGLGLTVAMQVTTLSSFDFTDPYSIITTISRFFALVGSYLAIIGLLLIARIPWVEQALGHDRLVVWHRKAMPYALFLIGTHVLLVLLGAAGANQNVIAVQLWDYITTYDWMLPATVGFVLMSVAGITSYKRARSKLKYETWWTVHLLTYLAVALSFMHQVLHGTMFEGHPLNQAYWTGLYLSVAIAIIIWRIALPLIRSWRHQLRVSRIEVDSPNTFSIYISGRNLHQLKAQGGQFFNWRFLAKGKWYENHPFSLSARPDNDLLRITIKALGEGTTSLATLEPGTRVMIEGPYGVFTKDSISQERRFLLIAGGVGITPIRALIDDLPEVTEIDVIYRASASDEVVLREELHELEMSRRIKLHLLIGSRDRFPVNVGLIRRLVPDFDKADVYVCGPKSLIDSVIESCLSAGVPRSQIHHEYFEFHAK